MCCKVAYFFLDCGVCSPYHGVLQFDIMKPLSADIYADTGFERAGPVKLEGECFVLKRLWSLLVF